MLLTPAGAWACTLIYVYVFIFCYTYIPIIIEVLSRVRSIIIELTVLPPTWL